MTLTLYNTLTRRKEPFEPLDRNSVRMYVCGPTVYDHAHIGNARPVIVFDVLFRLLRHIYGPDHVTYARNITDVDDKINARAAEQGVPIRELTERTAKQFHEDIAALGVLPPTVEPRATEHIEDMKRLIETLVAKGHAYVAEEHVLFHVPTMPDYGRLSNRSLEEMEAGARVEVAPYKKDPMDFVLWKPSKQASSSEAVGQENVGEPTWPSPCGIATPGRPGWHIECSAMANRWLWQEAKARLSERGLAKPHVFDIHGGGIDLVFPHHENEIAQSRCAHGTAVMAQVWMHNGFLQVEGQKMAKSLGNFVTIRDLLQEWPGAVLRYQMLMTHYRQPINWTRFQTEQAAIELDTIRALTFGLDSREGSVEPAVVDALTDDLNTPRAIAEIRQMMNRMRTAPLGDNRTSFPREEIAESIRATLQFLGIDVDAVDLQKLAVRRRGPIDEAAIIALVNARLAARKAKNFKEADRIRDELAAMGIAIKDGKDPKTGEPVTTWEVKR